MRRRLHAFITGLDRVDRGPGHLSGDMSFVSGMNDAGRWQGVITIRR